MKKAIVCIIALFLLLPFFSKAAVVISNCNYMIAESDTIISGKVSSFDPNYQQVIRFSFAPKANPNFSFEVGELRLSVPGQFIFSVKDFSVPAGYTLSWNVISKPIVAIGIPGQIPKTELE